MLRIYTVLCLILFGAQVFADDWEPCESEELTAHFTKQRVIEYEQVADDAFAIIVTVPTRLPKVELGGIFLAREEDNTRLLWAPLHPIATSPDVEWATVTLSTSLSGQYKIVVQYHLSKTYPDACWYEFKIPIES